MILVFNGHVTDLVEEFGGKDLRLVNLYMLHVDLFLILNLVFILAKWRVYLVVILVNDFIYTQCRHC